MEWHRRPEDIQLCGSCRILGDLARKMGLESDLSICDWAVTMQLENQKDGSVEVRSACGKELIPVELFRAQNMAKMAVNTAGEARDKTLGLGEAIARDQTWTRKALQFIGGIVSDPARSRKKGTLGRAREAWRSRRLPPLVVDSYEDEG